MTTPVGTTIGIPGNTVIAPDGTITLSSGVPGTIRTSDGHVEIMILGDMRIERDGTITLLGATEEVMLTTRDGTTIILSDGRIVERDGMLTDAQRLLILVGQGGALVTRNGSAETVPEGYTIEVRPEGSVNILSDSGGGGCDVGIGHGVLALVAVLWAIRRKWYVIAI